MKKIIRASLVASAITATAVMGLASNAKAETQTINFSGTVAESCTFGTATAGTLTTSADLRTLATTEAGGSAAQTTLTCNAASTVSIGSLSGTTVGNITLSGLTGYSANATVKYGALTANTTSGPGFAYGTDQTTTIGTLNVDLTASATNPLPADTYNYTVVVTATPNP